MTMEDKLKIIKNPVHFLAFGLGLGLIPYAPGTFGTLLGVLIYILYNWLVNFNGAILTQLLIIIITFVVGVYICGKTAKDLNYPDHPGIVWDEVVGYLVTMFNIKFSALSVILGFVLFRGFDILKPWPIKLIEDKFPGGLGVVLDDVMAGVYANIALNIILYALVYYIL